VYVDNGRERAGIDVLAWVQKATSLGAGEILLTSIDREGTREGFDNELVQAVSEKVTVPVIASGGMGQISHVVDPITSGASAVAFADIIHYERAEVSEIRKYLTDRNRQ